MSSLSLIKRAVTETQFSVSKQQTLRTLEESLGFDKAIRIVEGYEITPADYEKWLEVVLGYARDENINVKTKAAFQDVAAAVLENDPAPIDFDMQEAIINTLWANFKAQQQHSKVQKVVRAKEEEEQLMFALKKIAGKEEEGSSRAPAEGACGGRRSTEEEETSAFAQAYRAAFEEEEGDDEFTADERDQDLGDRDIRWRDDYQSDEDDWYKTQDADQDDLPFDDDERYADEDADIIARGEQFRHSRDLEDFDPASKEGIGRDEQIISRGRQQYQDRDLEDFDSVRRSKPKAFYAAENEETGKSYSSPFTQGQLVTCKKDGASYTVEIPDGPGDQVGILVNNRIKMVPSKDLEVPHAKEEEESTSKQSSGRISFLHDVLTGENSREHLTKLQQEVEIAGANEWTRHHAKMPKNPHPAGSIAFKAWQRGMEKAAKEVWAPKPVLDPNKAKQKPKPKRK